MDNDYRYVRGGDFAFPPVQQYIAPSQYGGNPIETYAPGDPSDASEHSGDMIDASSPLGKRKAPSESPPTSPPKRRGRGRPPGSKNKAKTASSTKPKPKPQPKVNQKKKRSNEENIPPTIDLADDSDSDVERNADGKIRHWNSAEKSRVFNFILGPDADRRFEQHKVNPTHVYKRASELFEGTRTPESVKSMFGRALETYGWIRAFEGFTGNGGGDADCDDAEAILPGRLAAARKSGLPLGSLKPATITEWQTNGWYDLFVSRLATSSKVARKVARNSASAISDIENDLGDDIGSDDANIDPDLRKPAQVPKTAAATVSEPKHAAPSAFRKQIGNSFSGLGDFMKIKAVAEEKKANVLDARLALDREKLELDKTKGKVEMAEKVLGMAGASDEVKVAANAFLFSIFATD